MTHRFACCLALTAFFTATASAQQAPTAAATAEARAVYASAKGDDSFLFFGHKYEKGKSYVVYNLYPGDEAPSQTAQAETESLKKQLAKKNVSFIDVAWKSEADLAAALRPGNITATVSDGKHIRLRGEKMNLSTTSGKAILLVSEGKVVTLCSGSDCSSRLKKFFGLTALN